MKRVILDCDPGIDDALAIILAVKSKKLQIEGITTVSGNTTIENSTKNTLKILTLLHQEKIAVYKGEEKPLKREPIYASGVHGEDGLAENNLDESNIDYRKESAIDFIISHILSNPNKITLVATGPLSNIAKSILKKPEICSKIEKLIIMGGTIFKPGNIKPHAEFNIYFDPDAAQIVFNSEINNIILVPLDITHKVIFTPNLLNRIEKKEENEEVTLSGFIYKIINFNYKFYMTRKRFDGCPLHDPLAIGVAIDPSFVDTEPMYIKVLTDDIFRGQIFAKFNKENYQKESNLKVNVSLKVDSERFMKYFIDTLNS